jgi:hypothetical protein|tara:strand:- start:2254 stop:2535 length:282 start_codon:yes stop_codon:yes gene_type:complete
MPEDYATKAYVDLRVGDALDTAALNDTRISTIEDKIETGEIPTENRVYMTQDEVDFLRNGIARTNALIVELDELKDNLIRIYNQLIQSKDPVI